MSSARSYCGLIILVLLIVVISAARPTAALESKYWKSQADQRSSSESLGGKVSDVPYNPRKMCGTNYTVTNETQHLNATFGMSANECCLNFNAEDWTKTSFIKIGITELESQYRRSLSLGSKGKSFDPIGLKYPKDEYYFLLTDQAQLCCDACRDGSFAIRYEMYRGPIEKCGNEIAVTTLKLNETKTISYFDREMNPFQFLANNSCSWTIEMIEDENSSRRGSFRQRQPSTGFIHLNFDYINLPHRLNAPATPQSSSLSSGGSSDRFHPHVGIHFTVSYEDESDDHLIRSFNPTANVPYSIRTKRLRLHLDGFKGVNYGFHLTVVADEQPFPRTTTIPKPASTTTITQLPTVTSPPGPAQCYDTFDGCTVYCSSLYEGEPESKDIGTIRKYFNSRDFKCQSWVVRKFSDTDVPEKGIGISIGIYMFPTNDLTLDVYETPYSKSPIRCTMPSCYVEFKDSDTVKITLARKTPSNRYSADQEKLVSLIQHHPVRRHELRTPTNHHVRRRLRRQTMRVENDASRSRIMTPVNSQYEQMIYFQISANPLESIKTTQTTKQQGQYTTTASSTELSSSGPDQTKPSHGLGTAATIFVITGVTVGSCVTTFCIVACCILRGQRKKPPTSARRQRQNPQRNERRRNMACQTGENGTVYFTQPAGTGPTNSGPDDRIHFRQQQSAPDPFGSGGGVINIGYSSGLPPPAYDPPPTYENALQSTAPTFSTNAYPSAPTRPQSQMLAVVF